MSQLVVIFSLQECIHTVDEIEYTNANWHWFDCVYWYNVVLVVIIGSENTARNHLLSVTWQFRWWHHLHLPIEINIVEIILYYRVTRANYHRHHCWDLYVNSSRQSKLINFFSSLPLHSIEISRTPTSSKLVKQKEKEKHDIRRYSSINNTTGVHASNSRAIH
jgi:hypothetical protein